MKYFNAANLIIFEFLRPVINFDFLFCTWLVHNRFNFPKKGLRSNGGLKYSKQLIVQSRFIKKSNYHDYANKKAWYKSKHTSRSAWTIEYKSKNQKQPLEVFCKKGVLKNFGKFTGKHLHQSLFFNKVVGLRPERSIEKILTEQNLC